MMIVAIAAIACVNDLTPEGGWSAPHAEGDKIFVGNKDGRLVRFDPTSGNLDNGWRYPEGDALGSIYNSPVVIGENIYGTGYNCNGDKCDGEIFALSLADGRSIWGQGGLKLKTKLVGDIGVVGDTILVGTTTIGEEEGSADGYVYALDASPDAPSIVHWRLPLDGNAFSGVAVDGDTAFISTMAGTVYAIDVSNAEDSSNPESRIKWTFDASGALAGPIHAEDGFIYFGDFGNSTYKLNTSTRTGDSGSDISAGNGEWKFDAGAWVWAKPVVEDGVVFISTLSGTVFAVDDSDGSEKWMAEVEGQVVAAPTLFDRKRGDTRERALGVPSGERNVWVISVIDGRELGVFVTDERVKSTPLIHGDFLYVHALNGDLKWFSVDDTTQRGCIDLKGGGRCD